MVDEGDDWQNVEIPTDSAADTATAPVGAATTDLPQPSELSSVTKQ